MKELQMQQEAMESEGGGVIPTNVTDHNFRGDLERRERSDRISEGIANPLSDAAPLRRK